MERDLRVLIVENEEYWVNTVKMGLKPLLGDYGGRLGTYNEDRVYWAKTPKQGLELLKSENPDIVILDMEFEGEEENKKGIEDFLIPARESGCTLPILAHSYDKSHRWHARKAGADEFIVKDRSNTDLRGAVAFLLERQKASVKE